MLRRNPLFRSTAVATVSVVALFGVLSFHFLDDDAHSDDTVSNFDEPTSTEPASPLPDVPLDADEEWLHTTEAIRAELRDEWQRMVEAKRDAAAESEPSETGLSAIDDLRDEVPEQWGEGVTGVRTRIDTDDKKVALTLDACDAGYDAEMIEFLRHRQIPATLFVAGRWVSAHGELLRELADESLFEIANHGLRHLPCSVSGKDAMEIAGTTDVRQVYEEIEENARRIQVVTGERPQYYRSGTAHYDEICVRIARKLGHETVNFDIVGDQGAMFSAGQVEEALLETEPGSIVVLHMNKPDSGTTEGLKNALPQLESRGYRFVTLSDISLK